MTGKELAERRRAVGLTQKQLGLSCGYPETSAERIIQKWEYEKRRIPPKKYRILAEALKIDVVELIP